MDFLLGCNYWASHAGTEMWKEWDEEAVREDLLILSNHGIKYLRVFPIWRDFQPIIPLMGEKGKIREYRMEGERMPENPYYLDPVMLQRFKRFCDICVEIKMNLIVGLITGWMSGRLFVPAALMGKNLYTDPTALTFEQRYVRGLVISCKTHPAICAWDLGNECNCMCEAAEPYETLNWTGTIANAIRAADPAREIISGMHSLSADENDIWSIQGQAEWTDILTTHPYPYWVPHAGKDKIGSFRTTMHATCETKLYGDIGQKPCLVEETGTMGPMLADNRHAADFLRITLFSNWANGAGGVFWWCANDQTNLTSAPYTWNMCEVELGLIDVHRRPKPVLKEYKKFQHFLDTTDFTMEPPAFDAVCILTQGQDTWGAAYMAWCLAKQIDITLRFIFSTQELPEADIYLMPSINGNNIMPRENYLKLMKKVRDGAVLYISNDKGILAEFEEFTGLRVMDSEEREEVGNFTYAGRSISFNRKQRYMIEAADAEVLAYDQKVPVFTRNRLGNGQVYYLNFPLETGLLEKNDAFLSDQYRLYETVFADKLAEKKVRSSNPLVTVTLHDTPEGTICVALNHSDCPQKTGLVFKGCVKGRIYRGNMEQIDSFDALVFSVCES